MENTTAKKAGRPSTKKVTDSKSKTSSVIKNENKVENNQPIIESEKTIEAPIIKIEHKEKVKIPLDTDISCKSAVRGVLTYISKRTNGYQVVWNDFGEENSIEYQELVSMRNTDLRFFKDNWIVIDDSDNYTAKEIMDSLRVSQYYNTEIDVDNFDSLFNENPEVIKDKVSKMSSGLKDTIAIRAKQLYNSGVLDSLNRIKAIEDAIGIEIVVRS